MVLRVFRKAFSKNNVYSVFDRAKSFICFLVKRRLNVHRIFDECEGFFHRSLGAPVRAGALLPLRPTVAKPRRHGLAGIAIAPPPLAGGRRLTRIFRPPTHALSRRLFGPFFALATTPTSLASRGSFQSSPLVCWAFFSDYPPSLRPLFDCSKSGHDVRMLVGYRSVHHE